MALKVGIFTLGCHQRQWVLLFQASDLLAICPSWTTTLPLLLFKDFRYQWVDTQYHEADYCLKWSCPVNFMLYAELHFFLLFTNVGQPRVLSFCECLVMTYSATSEWWRSWHHDNTQFSVDITWIISISHVIWRCISQLGLPMYHIVHSSVSI